MKNKAIEAMIRVQYNLKDTDQVDIEFTMVVDNEYEFKVTTYKNDIVTEEYVYVTAYKC